MTGRLDPDQVVVLRHLARCVEYLAGRAASVEADGAAEDIRRVSRLVEALRSCERTVTHGASPPIPPHPQNEVCEQCGSAEIECLQWVRANDDHVIGGNDCPPADDYWCPYCETHKRPVLAAEYCNQKGHDGMPCAICGTNLTPGP